MGGTMCKAKIQYQKNVISTFGICEEQYQK